MTTESKQIAKETKDKLPVLEDDLLTSRTVQ